MSLCLHFTSAFSPQALWTPQKCNEHNSKATDQLGYSSTNIKQDAITDINSFNQLHIFTFYTLTYHETSPLALKTHKDQNDSFIHPSINSFISFICSFSVYLCSSPFWMIKTMHLLQTASQQVHRIRGLQMTLFEGQKFHLLKFYKLFPCLSNPTLFTSRRCSIQTYMHTRTHTQRTNASLKSILYTQEEVDCATLDCMKE